MFIRRLVHRLLFAKIEQRIFERVLRQIGDQAYLRGGQSVDINLRASEDSMAKRVRQTRGVSLRTSRYQT
ncbi:hypothetical protein [Sulfitobacter sp. D7]|uniref:hypothetical protein n=1 Tax=Sulfitobacter sp. D7 TaxID=1968541 RepID=UPI0013C4016D|nr:hypothetical protein [Sulfitobacter sp. D7]